MKWPAGRKDCAAQISLVYCLLPANEGPMAIAGWELPFEKAS